METFDAPMLDADANRELFYVTEIAGGRITAIAPDGSKRTFANTGGAPNGAALGPDGYLYVTNNGGTDPGYIQRVDARGKVETLPSPASASWSPYGGNDRASDSTTIEKRHPHLTIVVDEAGLEWATYLLDRMDRECEEKGMTRTLKQKVTCDYAVRLYRLA